MSIKLDELRAYLGLGELYKDSANFKLRVLKPVAEELQQYGDLHFDINAHGFEIKNGKEVTGYRFHIMKSKEAQPAPDAATQPTTAHIITYLRNTYGCKDRHILQLQHILTDTGNYEELARRVTTINMEMKKKSSGNDPVKYPAAYAVKSILEHFNNR